MLFLIFINDLDSAVESSVLKFADDAKLFAKVNSDADREIIQKDLHQLIEWSNTWQMSFNTSKCKVLHFGNNNKEFSYVMGSHTLDVMSEEKDLGVCITNNLKAARQCHLAYTKANRVLGLIARTISYKLSLIHI